jgi:flagellar basal body-associated protein FliL
MLRLTLRGNFLPSFETNFLTSFAKVADSSYTYEKSDSMEDFDSPLRHPEYVVSTDKLVVNLSSRNPGHHAMGLFEFFIEAGTQEAAIELNDRQKEVVDILGRSLERMNYEDLTTADGKTKAKVMLRKEVNTILTKGRVRKVFFKTIVLKP